MLNLKREDVLGLDIGTYAVKMVALSKDDTGYKVKAAGIVEISANPEDNNQAAETHSNFNTNTINAIRDCFAIAKLRAKTKLRTNFAVCGVCGPEVAVRDFEFPSLPLEDIQGAVSLEAAQVCPFNAEQAAIDYQLISNSDDKTEGVLVAATNVLVTNKTQLAKEAGLKCVLMDIDGLALLNCFRSFGGSDQKSPAVILNVGNSYTTLAIMSDDGWPFIRDIDCAGNDIIQQISASNDNSPEDIKQILFDDSQDSEIKLDNSLEQACKELIVSVTETLRFYAAQEKSVPVKKIYVCGGFASARGFVELLNRRLGAEVILWNPFDNIQCEASKGCSDILIKNGPSMAVAAGLAMRAI